MRYVINYKSNNKNIKLINKGGKIIMIEDYIFKPSKANTINKNLDIYTAIDELSKNSKYLFNKK